MRLAEIHLSELDPDHRDQLLSITFSRSLRPDSFSAPNALIWAAFGVFARTF
jgi:hypothetical protein